MPNLPRSGTPDGHENASLTPQEWLEKNKEDYTSVDEIKSIENIEFAGRSAIELRGGGNISSVYKLYVLAIRDSLLIITEANADELGQILSTFKFTEAQF